MRFFGACINFDIGSCASLESTTELRKANSVSRDGNARPGSKNIKKNRFVQFIFIYIILVCSLFMNIVLV